LSTQPPQRNPSKELVVSLLDAARSYSTAAVVFHGAVAERFGLSATDVKALDVLQRLGSLTAGEIAAHTGLATASVTSLIDRLAKKRLVRRGRDARDRRRVVVMTTAQMEKSLAPLFEPLGRRMLARFREYPPDQIRVIREFLVAAAGDMREEAAKLGVVQR
jgi:DNA-binding MarR family transcriptional regulator